MTAAERRELTSLGIYEIFKDKEMNKKLVKSAVLMGASALMGISLVGCTINFGSDDSMPTSGMMGGSETSEESSASTSFDGMEIMFAQMMIPHHQQAVDMGELAETRASDPRVREIASRILNEQAPEIEQMKGWLDYAGAPMEMGHEMGMDGMLSEKEMLELEKATGAVFDKLYVEGMIEHHKGAILMAEMITNSKNAEARALAEAIVTSQTAQIKELTQILLDLG